MTIALFRETFISSWSLNTTGNSNMSRGGRREPLWGLATTPTPEVSVEAALGEAARGLTSLPGVLSVMVFDEKGSEFFRWHRTALDRERIGITGSDVIGLLKWIMFLLKKASSGSLEHMVVKAENNIIVIQAAGRGFLVAIADKAVNLAMLLIRVRDAASDISKMMR